MHPWLFVALLLPWLGQSGAGGGTEAIQASDAAGNRTEAPAAKPGPANATEQVPDPEKLTRSREAIGRMRDILALVLKHLEGARSDKDMIKLSCVNGKLTAIKGLLKISEQADVSLQEAVARHNSDAAQHEFEKVSIAVHKCEQLLAESEGCIGELAVYAGNTVLEVEVEGEPEDLTRITGEVIFETRPAPVSPYQ